MNSSFKKNSYKTAVARIGTVGFKVLRSVLKRQGIVQNRKESRKSSKKRLKKANIRLEKVQKEAGKGTRKCI